MFSFFKNKNNSKNTIDRVFATQKEKFTSLAELARKEPKTVFITWFEKTNEELKSFFANENIEASIITDREASVRSMSQVVFVEHYPLYEREKNLFDTIPGDCIVYTALDESFMRHFLQQDFVNLLQRMGMKENEYLEHNMITKSIQKAQQKLATQIISERLAHSQEEWMQKNVSATIL